MTASFDNVLAVAAATGRLGYVFMIDGEPYDWGLSLKASTSNNSAYHHTTRWISYYRPEVVIAERIGPDSRKGVYTRTLIDAVARAAQDAGVIWALVDRRQQYANKYAEAQALADRFPQLRHDVPKQRRLWESEPRKTIIFEAVALGLSAYEAGSSATVIPR